MTTPPSAYENAPGLAMGADRAGGAGPAGDRGRRDLLSTNARRSAHFEEILYRDELNGASRCPWRRNGSWTIERPFMAGVFFVPPAPRPRPLRCASGGMAIGALVTVDSGRRIGWAFCKMGPAAAICGDHTADMGPRVAQRGASFLSRRKPRSLLTDFSASAVPLQLCHPERSGEARAESKDLQLSCGFSCERWTPNRSVAICVPLSLSCCYDQPMDHDYFVYIHTVTSRPKFSLGETSKDDLGTSSHAAQGGRGIAT